MPVYEFKCPVCGQEITEFFKDIKDATISIPCSNRNCGGVATKIISKTSPPKFNGSGFYETDYKK